MNKFILLLLGLLFFLPYFRLNWFVMGFFFFWVEKDQDIVKMIIFKFISARLKKNLGLGGSKFILGGSNKKN